MTPPHQPVALLQRATSGNLRDVRSTSSAAEDNRLWQHELSVAQRSVHRALRLGSF
jgi:hypothetical protein